ncbi:MAG TPA: metallophosphoesterase [Gallionellaceae bacterium]|nr:metallophosphoesterase [Gallionellaceae bacterium]
MLAFLSVAFTIYGSMHFYALSKLWQALPHSASLGLVLTLAGIVMTLSPLILWQLTRQNWHGVTFVASWLVYLWLGFLFLFCCTSLVFDFGHLLTTFIGGRWPLNAATGLSSVALIALALMGYGFIAARQIQVEEIKIATPKLSPTIGRVTIAQISDLHLGVMLGDEFLQRVIAKLREIKPDIVVATGDVIDGQGDDLNALAQRFHSLQPPMGLFAITGNHEYFAGLESSLRFLRNAGFTVLRGEAAAAGGIILVGIDDHTAGAALHQEVKLDTGKALASVSTDDFIVLLKHQPVVDAETPFDLQLSGHIHGGQIFPFGIVPWLTYRVHSGLTRLADGRWLYVSRGTGTWGPPIRLFAAPEITLITIEHENN